jgi:hypothetical protein
VSAEIFTANAQCDAQVHSLCHCRDIISFYFRQNTRLICGLTMLSSLFVFHFFTFSGVLNLSQLGASCSSFSQSAGVCLLDVTNPSLCVGEWEWIDGLCVLPSALSPQDCPNQVSVPSVTLTPFKFSHCFQLSFVFAFILFE